MKSYKILFIFFILAFGVFRVNGHYLEEYLIESQHLTENDFIHGIAFEEVAILTSSNNLTYEQIETCLTDHHRDPGSFFLQFAEQIIKITPVDINEISNLTQHLTLGKFLAKHERREFKIASDIILGNLADQLNKGFEDGDLAKSNLPIMAIVETLKAYQYGVSIPVSNMEKGLHHLKKGNIGYIWSRLWFDYPYWCILGILTLLILFYYLIKRSILS